MAKMRVEQRVFLKAFAWMGMVGFLLGYFFYLNSQYRLFPPPLPSQGGYEGYVFSHDSLYYLVFLAICAVSLVFNLPAILVFNVVRGEVPVYWEFIVDVVVWTLILYLLMVSGEKKEEEACNLDDL